MFVGWDQTPSGAMYLLCSIIGRQSLGPVPDPNFSVQRDTQSQTFVKVVKCLPHCLPPQAGYESAVLVLSSGGYLLFKEK